MAASLLVCLEPGICAADAAIERGLRGPLARPRHTLDTVLDLESPAWAGAPRPRDRFDADLAAAREAAQAGRWRQAEVALAEATAVLAQVDGAVPSRDLFDLAWLAGAAGVHRGDPAAEIALRQAAAIAALEGTPPLPVDDPLVATAYRDAQRKLKAGGLGTLALGLPPPGTTYAVNGLVVGEGARTVDLYPGTHRVTAHHPDRFRPWTADVPILGDRTSTVVAADDPWDRAGWTHAQLLTAFDAVQAPEPVLLLLRDWCDQAGWDALELVRVDEVGSAAEEPPVSLSAPDPRRPQAAQGAPLETADGVPATYEEEVLARHETSSERRAAPEVRLQVLWFDPLTLRLSTEPPHRVTPDLDAGDRFRLGAALGYTRVLGHHHATVDLALAWRRESLEVAGWLGLARADAEYAFTPTWTDRRLYHVALGGR